MRLHFVLAPFLMMLTTTTLATPAAAQGGCVVSDPTGTPLNIRATPNGRVFSTVRNGQRVTVLDYDYDRRGRRWALVSFADRGVETRGWVFRRFIAC